MATLAKSAVALQSLTDLSASEFHAASPELIVRRLKLTLTGQGGAANTITAHALGFSLLVWASPLWDAQNSKGYAAVVDPVNNVLVLLDGSAAPAPVDVTSNAAYVTVVGLLDISPALT